MINLLPPQQKEEILEERRSKIAINLGIVFLAFFISFSSMLLSIKIYLNSRLEIEKINFQQKVSGNIELGKLQSEIENYNNIFSNLKDFYEKETDKIQIIDEIAKTIPSGVTINNLTVINSSQQDYRAQIILNGSALTRDGLLQFKKNLEGNKDFQEVSFPSSIWVQSVNINFFLNFKVK